MCYYRMADNASSNPGGSCPEKLKSYMKTPKGFILGAEIVSSLTFTPKGRFSLCSANLSSQILISYTGL